VEGVDGEQGRNPQTAAVRKEPQAFDEGVKQKSGTKAQQQISQVPATGPRSPRYLSRQDESTR
jgi:hypothetical protein